jgi:hypothetical protein
MRAGGDFRRGLLEGGHLEDLGYLGVREADAVSVEARSLFHSFRVRAIRTAAKWWDIGGVYYASIFCLGLSFPTNLSQFKIECRGVHTKSSQ